MSSGQAGKCSGQVSIYNERFLGIVKNYFLVEICKYSALIICPKDVPSLLCNNTQTNHEQ